METAAKSSFGTLLKIGDGAVSESFTTIASVRNIGGPELSLDTEEVTSHDSTDGWEEAIGTILHAGDVKFEINYLPTSVTHNASTGLIADMVARTRRNFKIVFPDGSSTTWTFAAFVTGVSPTANVKGALRASVTLSVTGKPTLA